jgi:hypothetical protein
VFSRAIEKVATRVAPTVQWIVAKNFSVMIVGLWIEG